MQPPHGPLLYAIHHTILAIAISCKGQVVVSLYHSLTAVDDVLRVKG